METSDGEGRVGEDDVGSGTVYTLQEYVMREGNTCGVHRGGWMGETPWEFERIA